ncbi:MAG: quaternary amine ABC transporter ATP-binding protein [Chloroflexota bacterium]
MGYIEVDSVDKIFGDNPEEALKLLDEGKTRTEIIELTGQVAAVVDATLTVDKGSIYVIMGLSGSGKSTLLRMFNRLIDPTRGTITIDGEEISSLSRERLRDLRARRISMVFQRFALFPHRTVMDNASFGLEIQGREKSEQHEMAQRAIDEVGLAGWEGHYPGQLSGGMQQRVGLARALATDPDILLMDEPFSALDPLIRREMQDQLIELQASLQKTIVFVTHDLNEAMRLGDEIAMMRDGRIVQKGTALEILEEPEAGYVASFIQDVDRSRVITVDSVMEDSMVFASPDASPAEALEKMEQADAQELFLVDGGREQLVGMVTRDGLTGAGETATSLDAAVIDDFPKVTPDTVIGDVFGLAARSDVPIAVVDEEGNVLGVVSREALLSAAEGVRVDNDS